MKDPHKTALVLMFSLLLLLGLGLIIGSLILDPSLAGLTIAFLVVGSFMALSSAVLIVLVLLYRRATQDEAFVRTGSGGLKVVIEGGTFVIPVIHEVIPVSLAPHALVVELTGDRPLVLSCMERANTRAEFTCFVRREEAAILQAAKSLGRGCTEVELVRDLIMEKLESALRSVGACRSLADLKTNPSEFTDRVHGIIVNDLEANGLSLESITISILDQED